MLKRGAFIAVGVAVLGLCLATPGMAESPLNLKPRAPVKVDKKTPVLMTADQMQFDRERGIVTAKGHVEISQGPRVLRADNVTYNQNTGVVTANGHVSLTGPGGEVIFAKSVKLTKELREGVIDNIRILFPDNSRFAANGAVRTGGNRTDMRKAVYSPCKICADKSGTPLWQIKAQRIVHDQVKKNIEYTDATLDMFGVPVFYMPYFWNADPTVKRRTGFLPPLLGNDSQLGFTLQTPFYINIAPDWDATLSPIFTTKQFPVGVVELRHRVLNGEVQVQGSITSSRLQRKVNGPLTKAIRGHVFTKGRFDIDNTWRWGFDGKYASDDTYLSRYNFTGINQLISRAFIEGFRGRSYASAETFYFQGLRNRDIQKRIPIIAPLLNYNFISEPIFNGSRWSLDVNALGLTRRQGTDSRRLTVTGGWQMPFIGRAGDLYTLSATVQSAVYLVNRVVQPNKPNTFSGVTGRFFPQVTLDWRYPWVREFGNVRQLIEPRMAISIAPNGNNSTKIPNEDSQDLEFDDTNLFSANRFPGLDRVDGGKRFTYGLRTAFYGDGGGQSEFFIGQSYRFRVNNTFGIGSGLRDHFSDFVGRVRISPSHYLDLLYRFRLDKKKFRARRSELRMLAGPDYLRLGIDYLFFGRTTTASEFGKREEITASVTAKIAKHWTIAGRTQWDLSGTASPLIHGISLTYSCECFLLTIDFSRRFTVNRDDRASTRVFVRIVFKNLGEVRTGK